MNTRDLLKQYDKNLSKMWDELSDQLDEKERVPYTELQKVKLRLFTKRNTWRLDWQENYAPMYEEGGIYDGDYANSYEVNYIADQIQTDFLLNKDTKRVIKNSCRQDLKISLIWQVIWVVDTTFDQFDRLLRYPVDCILVYNNERVYTTKIRKGNGYRDFIADKDFDIKDFI